MEPKPVDAFLDQAIWDGQLNAPQHGDVDEENIFERPSVVPDSIRQSIEATQMENAGVPEKFRPVIKQSAYREGLDVLCKTFAGHPEYFKTAIDLVDRARAGKPIQKEDEGLVK
jgi:hypothetical protein